MLSGFIGTAVFPLRKVQQFALEQLAAKRCDPVGEDHAFDVVAFVLDDPRLESRELLIVLDIERLGTYHVTWSTGLHVKIPFIDKISKKVSLKEQVIDFPPQHGVNKTIPSYKS